MKIKNIMNSPRIFKILVPLAFAIIIFNLILIVSTVFGASISGLFIPSSTQTTPGEMLPYGVTFNTAGYEKLLEYYNTITLDSLTQEQKARFIKIGTGGGDIENARTGCGPCCGIQNGAGIDSNGDIRCGCGHNLALVGLMKHLVKNYGDKYTDDQIFNEIVKWKKLFFLGQVADDGSVI